MNSNYTRQKLSYVKYYGPGHEEPVQFNHRKDAVCYSEPNYSSTARWAKSNFSWL